MSDEFDSLDATEKAATRATLIRCRVLAAKIANELRNKRPEHFVDRLSLTDIHASLERAASVLEQTIHTPTSTAKGLQERSRQRHRRPTTMTFLGLCERDARKWTAATRVKKPKPLTAGVSATEHGARSSHDRATAGAHRRTGGRAGRRSRAHCRPG